MALRGYQDDQWKTDTCPIVYHGVAKLLGLEHIMSRLQMLRHQAHAGLCPRPMRAAVDPVAIGNFCI